MSYFRCLELVYACENVMNVVVMGTNKVLIRNIQEHIEREKKSSHTLLLDSNWYNIYNFMICCEIQLILNLGGEVEWISQLSLKNPNQIS